MRSLYNWFTVMQLTSDCGSICTKYSDSMLYTLLPFEEINSQTSMFEKKGYY